MNHERSHTGDRSSSSHQRKDVKNEGNESKEKPLDPASVDFLKQQLKRERGQLTKDIHKGQEHLELASEGVDMMRQFSDAVRNTPLGAEALRDSLRAGRYSVELEESLLSQRQERRKIDQVLRAIEQSSKNEGNGAIDQKKN